MTEPASEGVSQQTDATFGRRTHVCTMADIMMARMFGRLESSGAAPCFLRGQMWHRSCDGENDGWKVHP